MIFGAIKFRKRLGLEIGFDELHLVESDKLNRPANQAKVTIPEGLITPKGIRNPAAFTNHIIELLLTLKEDKNTAKEIVIGLPDCLLLAETIRLPETNRKELKRSVDKEARRLENTLRAEVEHGFKILNLVEDEMVDVLVIACAKQLIADCRDSIERAGLKFCGLELKTVALGRIITGQNLPYILCEVNADHATLSLWQKGRLLFISPSKVKYENIDLNLIRNPEETVEITQMIKTKIAGHISTLVKQSNVHISQIVLQNNCLGTLGELIEKDLHLPVVKAKTKHEMKPEFLYAYGLSIANK